MAGVHLARPLGVARVCLAELVKQQELVRGVSVSLGDRGVSFEAQCCS